MLLLMNDFLDFKKEIQVKEFSAGRICESRWIKHWISMGLLFNDTMSEENKWNKFSFVELIWLKAILKMRQFGLSLEDIKIVKNYISQINDGNANNIKSFLDILSFAIMRMEMELLFTKSENDEGKVLLMGSSDARNPFQSYISISINGLIMDFIMDFESEGNVERYFNNIIRFNLMTEPELELLELKRRGIVGEIQIFNEKGSRTNIINKLNDYVEIMLQSKYTTVKYVHNDVEKSFKRHNKLIK